MKDRLLEMLKAASRERPFDRYEAATELFISEAEYVSRATKIFKAVRAMDGVAEGQIGGLV